MKSLKIIFIVIIVIFASSCGINKKNIHIEVYKHDDKLKSYLIQSKIDNLYDNKQKAKENLKLIIDADSNYATAYYELSNLLLKEKSFDLALNFAHKAYNLNPTNFWFTHLYIDLLELNHKIDEAQKQYETLINNNIYNIELWYSYFSFLDRNALYNLLNKKFSIFETKFGITDEIMLNRYQTFLKQSKHKETIKYLNSILLKEPDNNIANLLLADFYTKNKNIEKANECYQRILNNNPNNEQALIGLLGNKIQNGNANEIFKISKDIIVNSSIDINFKLGLLVEFSEKFEKNKLHVDSKIDELILILKQQYPDNSDVLGLYGNLLYKKGKSKEALENYLKALSVSPSNLQNWILTLYILEKEKSYSRIISVADSALIYFPNQKDLFLFRGFGNMQMDNYEQSYQDFIFALKLTGALDSDRTQILHYLAEICHKLNNIQESYKYYEEILKINKNDLIALNNYAYYLSLESENLTKALEMSAKTIKIENKNSTYLDTYAYILFELTRYKEALKYIELAILNGGGNNSVILEHYGDILFMNGNTEVAIATWKEALEKGGNSDILILKIEKRTFLKNNK